MVGYLHKLQMLQMYIHVHVLGLKLTLVDLVFLNRPSIPLLYMALIHM